MQLSSNTKIDSGSSWNVNIKYADQAGNDEVRKVGISVDTNI